MFPLLRLFLFFAFASTAVFACEGECVVNVTRFVLHSYSNPVYDVFQAIAGEIEDSIIAPSSRAVDRLDYITPLLSAYEGNSYPRMETAIFPSYFHGKCVEPTLGVTPAGCPNPSCPVVCGTPGSMAYHFPKLRRIAFDTVHSMLFEQTREGSDTYNAVQKAVKRFASTRTTTNPKTRSIPRIFWARKDLDPLLPKFEYLMKRADDIGAKLRSILESVPERLASACGYVGPDNSGSADELQGCSWEEETVTYILRFP